MEWRSYLALIRNLCSNKEAIRVCEFVDSCRSNVYILGGY